MQVSPLIENQKPDYPVSEEIDNISSVLESKKLKKWNLNRTIGVAFSSISLLTLNNCSSFDQIAVDKFNSLSMNDTINYVAPIFEHGVGIGTYGCLIVAPPVFINEDDARQIIIDGFDDYGIELFPDSLISKNIVHSRSKTLSIYDRVAKTTNEIDSVFNYNLKFVAVNREKDFAVYYVSDKEYIKFIGYGSSNSSIESHNYILLAEEIVNTLKSSKMNGVVFYDPFTIKFKNSKDSIKAQIHDFIEWFKKEKK